MRANVPLHVPPVLALGITGQVGQIVLLRELLMVFQGNEASLGIILAAWMAWVGVGSRLAAGALRCRAPLPWLLRDAVALVFALPATVLLVRTLPGWSGAPPGAPLSVFDMVFASVTVMAPVGLLLGAQFVLLARVWRERDGAFDASGAAKTYAGEAAGNVAGGLLFTFVLVRALDAFQVAVLVAGLLLAAALRSAGRRWWPLAVATVALLPLLPRVDDWAAGWHWRLRAPDYRLVDDRVSRYGAVSVLQRDDQTSFFQSGQLVFTTGGADEVAVALEEQPAVTLAHLALTQHADPRRVLLIGGGLRGTLRELTRHPVTAIDYVELDPVLVDAALPHLEAGTRGALADPRVRLIHGDGRLHVKTTDATYDVIVVDVPDPTTAVLNRFYTREFYAEAAARLAPGGVLVTGAVSTPDLRGSAIANRNATLYHTLRTVFDEVIAVGLHDLHLIASNDPTQPSADAAVLMRRYADRGVDSPGFSPGRLALLFDPDPLLRLNWLLHYHGRSPSAHLEPPPAPPLSRAALDWRSAEGLALPPVHERVFVNADARPVAIYHSWRFWTELTRRDAVRSLRWLGHVQAWWALPPLAVIMAVGLLLGRLRATRARAGPRLAVGLALFTTGMSTMTLQIALLFAFQSVYGFVFEMVGLIVALFMAGLALGAAGCQRWVGKPADRCLLAAVQAAVATFALLAGVLLPGAAALGSPAAVFAAFAAVTFVAGALAGIGFPLATACFLALDPRPERAAGAAYAVELAGACTGAAIASAVIAPVFGIAACCFLAALVNGAAFVVLAGGTDRAKETHA